MARTVQEDGEDLFVIPAQFRGKAVVRDRCSAGDVAPFSPERVAGWRVDRAARLAGIRDRGEVVDCRQLGPGWRPVSPEEFEDFEDFERWTAGDAAVAEISVHATGIDRSAVVDSWRELRGLPFAVEAFARFCETRWSRCRNEIVLHPASAFAQEPGSWPMALRLLDLMRSASDAEYEEAVSVADRIRQADGEGIRGAVAALLVPERPDWWDEAIAGHVARGQLPDGLVARMLFASVTDPEQVRAISALTGWWNWTDDVRAEATLFAVGGGAAARFLAHRGRAAEDRRSMGLLAKMPGDEAVAILIEDVRQGRSGAQKALLAAGQRYPRRTLRLLAEATPDTQVSAVLRLRVLADPDLAASEAPRLLGPARERVETLLAADVQAGPPTADQSQLPSALVSPSSLAAPALPPWAEPDALPSVLLADRNAVLPSDAVRVLVQMLSISTPDTRYPDLDAVDGFCDPASLTAFAWALFEAWRLAGYPAGQRWVLTAQGIFGDDGTAERLVPLIRSWPGEGGHARAVAALDALAAIGTDRALAALHGLSLKGKFKALKTRAGERITAVAASRGLDAEQLADRLVPDLGLDADGTMTVDFGARRFAVHFDEILRPSVHDASGNRLKALPKPGAQDDPVLAPEAYQHFSAMKKQLRTLAADQLWRLEQAMCTRRRWTRAEFADLLVTHPLLRHTVRALVWCVYSDGVPQACFRVAEDLTFADSHDDRYEIPDDARIGLVHPVEMGPALTKWREVFSDYEILQPFEQLDRAKFELTAAEADAVALKRFADATAPVERLAALERRGWRRGGAYIDGGTIAHCFRPLPDGTYLILPLDPGIDAGSLLDSGPQSLSAAWISVSPHDYRQQPPHHAARLSRIDSVTMSEIIRDLAEATA